jgi:ubiquinone/menaquinone biosynthesis C-methylase UbiE
MTGGLRSREVWDREYLRCGRRFRGAAPDLPLLPPGAIVLEAGCGDGKSLFTMINNGWQVLAIDFSTEAIKVCRRSPVLREFSYLIANVAALPVCENSCDAVILSHVTGHASEQERKEITKEAIRVLKPGGLLYFRDFSCKDFRAGNGRLTETGTRLRGNGIYTHYFTPFEIRDLFSELSFISIREDTWFIGSHKNRLPRAEIVAEFRKSQKATQNIQGYKAAVLIAHPSN